jgi:hypothetical protein
MKMKNVSNMHDKDKNKVIMNSNVKTLENNKNKNDNQKSYVSTTAT